MEEETREINYKDDFNFILELTDCQGKDIGIPDYDWTAKFFTSMQLNVFVASRINGVYKNCFEDNGKLHIVCNNHGLTTGTLRCEFTADLPNDMYPDGRERIVVPKALNIELVRGAAPCPCDMEVKLMLPYIKGDKGDPFTYADFTPEQIAELQKPALDAAEQANEATLKAVEAAGEASKSAELADTAAGRAQNINSMVSAAENMRVENENARITNEELRKNDETVRQQSEQIRIKNETERIDSETKRVSSESERENAEKTRAENEAQRKSNEQSRQSAEKVRENKEETRIANEQERVSDENARKVAETQRATEFRQIKTDAETATSEANSAAEAANSAAGNANTALENLNQTLEGKQDKLTNSDDLNISETNELTLTEKAKRHLFDDQWKKALGWDGGVNHAHVDENGIVTPYKAYDLWLTYEEAIVVFMEWRGIEAPNMHSGFQGRTFIPISQQSGLGFFNFSAMFARCDNLEVVKLSKAYALYVSNLSNCFLNCNKLVEIIGDINMQGCTNAANCFNGCQALKEVKLTQLKINMSFQDSPLLSLESFQYMITNAANTTAITITVHPDVYDKLTDPENGEWFAVLTLAQSKNISFATV